MELFIVVIIIRCLLAACFHMYSAANEPDCEPYMIRALANAVIAVWGMFVL